MFIPLSDSRRTPLDQKHPLNGASSGKSVVGIMILGCHSNPYDQAANN
jgi:hypothetical protein